MTPTGVLVGFITAYVLFEITEKRRIKLAQQELRRALLAELEVAEALVNSFVTKYARLCINEEDIAYMAKEIRWFQDEGRHQFVDLGILDDIPNMPADYKTVSDDQLVRLHSSINETIGNKLILPIVDSVLAGRALGFSTTQLKALSMVRWQTYLLEQHVESMKESYRQTFTVTDAQNHETVLENHRKSTKSYAGRTLTLLRAIRAAIPTMQ